MKPSQPRRAGQPPVGIYAAIIGVLVIATIFFSTQFGRNHQNPVPSGVSSPQPGASTGPTPRY